MTDKSNDNPTRAGMRLLAGVLMLGLFVACCGEASAAEKAKAVDAQTAIKQNVESYSISGTVDEAFGKVEKIGNVFVYVDWDGLRQAGVKKTKRVAVTGRNHTLKQIISRLVTKSANRGRPLGWLISENVVIITSQPRAMQLRKRLRDIATAPRAGKQTSDLKKNVAGNVNEFNFDAMPLSDVIDYLRSTLKVNIHVNWKALESVGVSKGTEVTLKVKNVSAAKAMDLIFSDINATATQMDSVYWVVDDGVVEISTGSVLNRTMRTRVFDVSDLLHITADSQGPRVELRTIGEKCTDDSDGDYGEMFEEDRRNEKKQSTRQKRQVLNEKLISIIKNSIGEDMWQPIGKGSIKIYKKQLVITQSLLGFKLMEKSLK